MNDAGINTQDFALAPNTSDFNATFSEDSARRQQLHECTTGEQRAGVWNNHGGCEL